MSLDSTSQPNRSVLTTVGWREYVDFPNLGLSRVKAKIDTGARTSALHASAIDLVDNGDNTQVRFRVPLDEGDNRSWFEADLLEYRGVKSSNGHTERRAVITSVVHLGPLSFTTEITLTDRQDMSFPALIGRETLRRRFLVDPDASFLTEGR